MRFNTLTVILVNVILILPSDCTATVTDFKGGIDSEEAKDFFGKMRK